MDLLKLWLTDNVGALFTPKKWILSALEKQMRYSKPWYLKWKKLPPIYHQLPASSQKDESRTVITRERISGRFILHISNLSSPWWTRQLLDLYWQWTWRAQLLAWKGGYGTSWACVVSGSCRQQRQVSLFYVALAEHWTTATVDRLQFLHGCQSTSRDSGDTLACIMG